MRHLSDSDHCKLDAIIRPDCIIESHEISDPSQGLRRVPITKLWRTERVLGHGGFGEVHLQSLQSDKKSLRALKIIPTKGFTMSAADCQRELVAMIEFQKTKYKDAAVFVDFYGWFQSDEAMVLAMEYMPLGDLEQNLREIENSPTHEGPALPEADVQEITQQILEGLDIMHAEGFAHRDLKPQNVFVVQKTPHWWVKLGDFGLSKQETGQTVLRTQAGTQQYMAPELYYYVPGLDPNSSEYTNAVDLWALGCIIYRAMAGAVPFPNLLSLRNYCQDSTKSPLIIPSTMKEAGKLVEAFLQPSPAERPSAKDALESTWLTQRTKPNVGPQNLQSSFTSMNISNGQPNYNSASHMGLQSNYSIPSRTSAVQEPSGKESLSEPLPAPPQPPIFQFTGSKSSDGHTPSASRGSNPSTAPKFNLATPDDRNPPLIREPNGARVETFDQQPTALSHHADPQPRLSPSRQPIPKPTSQRDSDTIRPRRNSATRSTEAVTDRDPRGNQNTINPFQPVDNWRNQNEYAVSPRGSGQHEVSTVYRRSRRERSGGKSPGGSLEINVGNASRRRPPTLLVHNDPPTAIHVPHAPPSPMRAHHDHSSKRNEVFVRNSRSGEYESLSRNPSPNHHPSKRNEIFVRNSRSGEYESLSRNPSPIDSSKRHEIYIRNSRSGEYESPGRNGSLNDSSKPIRHSARSRDVGAKYTIVDETKSDETWSSHGSLENNPGVDDDEQSPNTTPSPQDEAVRPKFYTADGAESDGSLSSRNSLKNNPGDWPHVRQSSDSITPAQGPFPATTPDQPDLDSWIPSAKPAQQPAKKKQGFFSKLFKGTQTTPVEANVDPRPPPPPSRTVPMPIFVKTLTGKTWEFPAFPTDTVAALKSAIYEQQHIPPDQQRVIFRGKELVDDNTLWSYNVKPNDTIHLVLRLRRPEAQHNLVIKTLTDRTYDVEYNPNDTVYNVKEKIARKYGLSTDQQTLFYDEERLENYHGLGYYDIVAGSVLNLVLKRRESTAPIIHIKTLTGVDIPIQTSLDETIFNIKGKVLDKEGIPIAVQRLIFAGRELDNSRTAKEYGIEGGSTVHLVLRMLGENITH